MNPLLGLRLNPTTKAPSDAKSAPPATKPAPADAPPKESGPADSLAALAADESAGLPSIEESFPDEIPATAPDRELPDDMSETMQKFVKSLDGIYSIMDDPELFGQYIRTIMMELRENPQYKKLLTDDDVAVMIRGMRESMGLAKIKKEESKAKRGGTARSRKSNPADNEMLDSLQALAAESGISFDG